MTGYKAFNQGFRAYGNFQYEIGKAYTISGKLKMCANGFHFCQNLIDVFGYYSFDRNKTVLAEVEATGKIEQEGTKFCSERIKIIREVSWDEVDKLIQDGNLNSGRYNSGFFNSGSYNSGNLNSGSYNSGSYNSGSYNSGSYNSGNLNSGSYNSGSYNSGSYNSGNLNSGDYNSGSYNSGSYNSGGYNSGNLNSGFFNSGNLNSGFFNSNNPTVRLFNRESGMTFEEVFSLRINWSDLTKSKDIIKKLPNYDAQIFLAATGIDWRNDNE